MSRRLFHQNATFAKLTRKLQAGALGGETLTSLVGYVFQQSRRGGIEEILPFLEDSSLNHFLGPVSHVHYILSKSTKKWNKVSTVLIAIKPLSNTK